MSEIEMSATPLKIARRQQHKTLADLAAEVGTDAGNLSRIENGKQSASLELAEKLVKALGYAVTEIHILYPQRFCPEGTAWKSEKRESV
jgi:transcriptional regulator with XRE-family HTH domain